MSRALRHVKVKPEDYSILGLRFNDYFLDTCVAFGLRHGSRIFQHLSDAVWFIMSKRGSVTNQLLITVLVLCSQD